MNKTFYITTTTPYVNADPHIGFAFEIVQADVIARLRRAEGNQVFFNTGTDEHGLKIYRNAVEAGEDTQSYVDRYAAKFDNLKSALNLSYTNFIRTTDETHVKAAQEFWKKCDANGDIYKKEYKIKYCVGCELEKTDSELENDKCPIHPNQELEIIEEENYFFRFSKYQKPLLELYEKHPEFVVPASRLNEIKRFVERGLEDFSISRLKSKLPWGVPVPGDDEQIMYVWFDALVNYIAAIGWPKDIKQFETYWPGVQVAGKDNLRQQSAMWQAMLLSAGLPTTKQIFIHGFITHDGAKMSKSVGNVVDPYALVKEYGTDAVRYFLLRGIHAYEDGDFSTEKFETLYNADLANGIGNLLQRVTTLAEQSGLKNLVLKTDEFDKAITEIGVAIEEALTQYEFHTALESLWRLVALGDVYINDRKPWEQEREALEETLANASFLLLYIARLLQPFLPETSEKIFERFGANSEKAIDETTTVNVKKEEPLFQRLP